MIFVVNYQCLTPPVCEDKRVTEDLKRILEIINVRLLDYIVVALTETYSFAEHGLM